MTESWEVSMLSRRTVKTNMLRAGVDPVYRDLILGHSLGKMDRFYLKPSEDDLSAAMEEYTEWFDGQVEGKAEMSQLPNQI
jgi:hypothetical protein